MSIEAEIKNKLLEFIDENKPFAIIQYFERLVVSQDTYKRYEMLYINGVNKLCCCQLHESELDWFKKNLSLFDLVKDNKYGKVYECNGLRQYIRENDVNLSNIKF